MKAILLLIAGFTSSGYVAVQGAHNVLDNSSAVGVPMAINIMLLLAATAGLLKAGMVFNTWLVAVQEAAKLLEAQTTMLVKLNSLAERVDHLEAVQHEHAQFITQCHVRLGIPRPGGKGTAWPPPCGGS